MKVIETDDLTVSLSCSESLEVVKRNSHKTIYKANYQTTGWIELDLKGHGYCIWPNREGEGFKLDKVFPALKKNRCLDTGISLSWPATASTQAVAFLSNDGLTYLFRASGTEGGRHREIRIYSDSKKHVRIRFTGIPCDWIFEKVESFAKDPGDGRDEWACQFQAGMIGPDGINAIPGNKGFDFLVELADMAHARFGPFGQPPIMHVFGYARGHDIGYPDYRPSEVLGGIPAFKRVVDQLHERGFLLSCYMNGRIMEDRMTGDFPELKEAICLNPDSSYCTEVYHGRRFFVMDPNNQSWLKVLENQALQLKSLGVDIVQLDQLAGRAAAVPPGQPWGSGYASLIEKLREKGLKIWIQGVSDYYGADWYEMTWRNLNILEGGILRGGNPFGETDLTLAKIVMPGNRYLIPLAKTRSTGLPGNGTIIDIMGERGELPLINESYLEYLKRPLHLFNREAT